MDLAAQIKHMIDQKLANGPHFALDVRVNARLNPAKIVVTVDGDNGITIDDCANISRTLSDALNQDNVLEDYNLEVTTPGADQPLKLPRQYTKHIGRNLKVDLKDNAVMRGKLIDVDANSITIEEEKKDKKAPVSIQKLAFDQIQKTIVMISFK